MLRRFVERLAHPIGERLTFHGSRFLPGQALSMSAANRAVLLGERGASLWGPPRTFPFTAARHRVSINHLLAVYSNYFDFAMRFLLISHGKTVLWE